MGELAPHEEKILNRLQGDIPGDPPPTLIDVGANVGSWSLAAKERWPGCYIKCFEPNPVAFEALRANLDVYGGGVDLHPFALSDQEGEAVLHYSGGPDLTSSLYDRDLSYEGIHNFQPQEIVVPVLRLDNFIHSYIDLLKIDAEGHELEVMHGAGDKLIPARVGRIQWEFNSCALDSRTFFKDFWDLLTPLGYRISLLDGEGGGELITSYDPGLEDFRAHREFLAE